MPKIDNLDSIISAIEDALKGANGFSKPIRAPMLRKALEVLRKLKQEESNSD